MSVYLDWALQFMSNTTLNWEQAPPGWNWAAQDADGKWYWYSNPPIIGVGGGIWRANSRAQLFAFQGASNPYWYESLCERPANPNVA